MQKKYVGYPLFSVLLGLTILAVSVAWLGAFIGIGAQIIAANQYSMPGQIPGVALVYIGVRGLIRIVKWILFA